MIEINQIFYFITISTPGPSLILMVYRFRLYEIVVKNTLPVLVVLRPQERVLSPYKMFCL